MKIAHDKRDDLQAVIACLIANGTRREKSALYADAYIEYRIAQANISKNGPIVINPRTQSPVANPYLPIRDKAFARLEALHKSGVKAAELW